MPTEREREYYAMGFRDGFDQGVEGGRVYKNPLSFRPIGESIPTLPSEMFPGRTPGRTPGRKRKLSAWQKYIKNPRNHIKYRDGKLNLKKMGVAYRRKRR